ncbi:MAG: 50S ribosomal protein L29 [Deltaproteobacteria bacterium]|nr:50S ribosomal protein L29 [Deltaproteobacteria bacterium]OQX66334.1 MAG: 50S ribosomal protein L29 [Desulfococcus sp. 4484_242]
MKAKELRDLSMEELREKEREVKQELFNLRFQKATGQLSNTAIISKTKKDLARVKTVLREMSAQGQSDNARA